MPPVSVSSIVSRESLLDRQQAFGYTQEDLKLLMAPMAVTGQEAVGSMGTDTRWRRCLRSRSCSTPYFKQNFAQVTTRRSTRSARNW